MECLLYHQFIAMRAARVIDPGPFIQPPRLNDKRIVVHPFSNGVAVPPRLQNLFRKLSPVRPNIPPTLAILITKKYLIFVLQNLFPSQLKNFYTRNPNGSEIFKGPVIILNRNGRTPHPNFM